LKPNDFGQVWMAWNPIITVWLGFVRGILIEIVKGLIGGIRFGEHAVYRISQKYLAQHREGENPGKRGTQDGRQGERHQQKGGKAQPENRSRFH